MCAYTRHMSSNRAHLRPGQILATRVREARKRRGWRQQDLADRLAKIGHRHMPRTTIAKIEQGGVRADRAQLWEVMALAAALGVPPVHLITPDDDGAIVQITAKIEAPAIVARGWIRGERPLNPDDREELASFIAAKPIEELRQLMGDMLPTLGVDPLVVGLGGRRTYTQEEAAVARAQLEKMSRGHDEKEEGNDG